MITAARWLARHRQLADCMLAAALLTAAVIVSSGGAGPARATVPRLLLVAGATVPLAFRHRAPVAVFTASALATVAAAAVHVLAALVVVAPLVALYTVAATSTRRVSLAVGGATLAGLIVAGVAGAPASIMVNRVKVHSLSIMFPAVVIAMCWLIGDNVRVRRAYLAELRDKARRTESERTRELAAATDLERARIARELHDVVVHHVSVIAVQAGAARMLADQRLADRGPAPQRLAAREAPAGDPRATLSAIEDTARQALGELRQILGLLRHAPQPPLRTPQRGLEHLDRLLDDTRSAGLPITSRIHGQPVPLTSAVDLAAYRIVQEALTNVLKHQGCVPTTLSVRYHPRSLEIEVTSRVPATTSAAAAPEGDGHGLVGMRERVAILGGELHAGGRPDGGFMVAARIPLRQAPA